MDETARKLRDVLVGSVSPAVLCSFGKDSLLLLYMVRQLRPNTPVIWFRTGLDESFGRRIIREWNLTVLRWRPMAVYTLEGEGRTLVQEFSFGADRLPMLTDVVAGDGCAAEKFPTSLATVYPPFDMLLVGWKDTDSHWVKGGGMFAEDGAVLGNSRLYAPLRHMTDEAVMAAIVERRIPYEPTPDELPACTECVSTMPLDQFRSKYNLEVTDGPDIR